MMRALTSRSAVTGPETRTSAARRPPPSVGNQALLRRLAAAPGATQTKCAECEKEAASRETETGTRDDEESEEVATESSTPAPAPPVSPPNPPAPPTPPPSAPAPKPAAPAKQCDLAFGPTYTSTSAPVTISKGRKRTRLDFAAQFKNDPAGGKPCSCCEVRQYIKWDNKYAEWRGGPPHKGFPAGLPPDAWYEDRDPQDKRYGHRSGPHSDPSADCIDEYKTADAQDMANGDSYCGSDRPRSPTDAEGQWQFQLKVVDTCNGDAEKGKSGIITVDW